MNIQLRRNSRGDTIVEVMIAIALIGATLGIATSIANQALRVGIDSKQRTEALALAQGQVELIKAEYKNNSSFANIYQIATAYCLTSTSPVAVKASSDPACTSGSFTTAVNYSKGVFKVVTSWQSLRSNNTASTTLYYKIPGSF